MAAAYPGKRASGRRSLPSSRRRSTFYRRWRSFLSRRRRTSSLPTRLPGSVSRHPSCCRLPRGMRSSRARRSASASWNTPRTFRSRMCTSGRAYGFRRLVFGRPRRAAQPGTAARRRLRNRPRAHEHPLHAEGVDARAAVAIPVRRTRAADAAVGSRGRGDAVEVWRASVGRAAREGDAPLAGFAAEALRTLVGVDVAIGGRTAVLVGAGAGRCAGVRLRAHVAGVAALRRAAAVGAAGDASRAARARARRDATLQRTRRGAAEAADL